MLSSLIAFRSTAATAAVGRVFTAASLQYLTQGSAFLYPLTFSAWIKPVAINVDQCVVSFGLTGTTNRRQMLYLNVSGLVGMQSRTDAGAVSDALSTAGPASAGVRFHVAGVVAAANSRAAYYAGGNKGSNTTSRTSTAPNLAYIGASTSPSLYFNGEIDDVAIWNVALSDANITSLASGVSPPDVNSANLWGYWAMTNASPEADSSGNGRNMTLVNF